MLFEKKMRLSTLTVKHHDTRAQVWSFDLLVALIIFVIGMIIIYFFALNYKSSTFDELGELYYDADLASNILLSEEAEGIVSNGKINQTKLDSFDALPVAAKKLRLGVSYNFYFSIPNMTISGNPQQYAGIVNTSAVDSQIKLTRIVVYNNQVTKMEVISWR